jgi:DnaJ-class molecular chaperone
MEIIICDCCKGKGKVSERTSAYDSEYVNCNKCNGSGRLIKEIVYKPYVA